MTYPDLKNATVLLTGGAMGIGEAMVRAFAGQGASVWFCDVDAGRGKRLTDVCGGGVHFDEVDLRDELQVNRWIELAAERAGGEIDVLVNNAAIDPRIPIAEFTAEDWSRVFETNLRPCFFTARQVVPLMPAVGGSIINFSSITFHIAPVAMTAYVASKAAILGFTRSLARELGPRKIRVNAISPGWVMTERQLEEHVTPEVVELIRRSQCISELIQPEEIANIALFLASDASSAITGQEILADRGWAHS